MSEGSIHLDGLWKQYGGVDAVAGIDVEIESGEFFTLLGPSGCGKTTTLRLIAGFETPTAGAIRLDGTDVSKVPAHKRRVNTVFQSYALFPHKTVAENVAFGLKYRKVSKADMRRKVGEALELVRLEGLDARRPSQLSGGQQQRVALARALVLEPPVLLLDEPLGALDARLRLDLQVELKRIQEQLGITFVYVTHDQDEALTMSDRVAVMKGGRVEQLAAPQALYEEPETAFVANFLGSSNLIAAECTACDDGATDLRLGDFGLRAVTRPAHHHAAPGETVMTMIRPENVRLRDRDDADPSASGVENVIPAMVEEVVYLGFHREVRVRLATGALVRADVPNDDDRHEYAQGDAIAAELPARHLRVLAHDEELAAGRGRVDGDGGDAG